MKDFKRQHFARENEGKSLPVTVLPDGDCRILVERLLKRWALEWRPPPYGFRSIVETLQLMPNLNAENPDFSMNRVWKELGVVPLQNSVFSTDGLRTVNCITASDLNSLFEYVWYPVSDDMLVFSEEATWCVLIDHNGYVYGRTSSG